MWIQKLSGGVLRVLTPLGPRYVRPSLVQRVYLLWIFRHFQTLPLKVLSRRQTKLIEAICSEQSFVALRIDDLPLLGTLEQRPPAESEELPPRRPNARVADSVQTLAARQRS